jgi:hypothetical protein
MLGEELNSLAEEVKLSKCSLDVREIQYLSCIIISLLRGKGPSSLKRTK